MSRFIMSCICGFVGLLFIFFTAFYGMKHEDEPGSTGLTAFFALIGIGMLVFASFLGKG